MNLSLSENIKVQAVTGGCALFNVCTGDTHLIKVPFANLINTLLQVDSISKAELANVDRTSPDVTIDVDTFITQAIELDIIKQEK